MTRSAAVTVLFRQRPAVALAGIVLFALLLRMVFFVGLVSGDPQDDGIYYGNAFGLYNDGPRYFELFRNLPDTWLANPIDQFHVRPAVTYPIAASFALIGPGEWAAVLWGLLCSIGSVLVVFRLGELLHGSSVGLLAALLCAFYPLEVINGTRILSDVQVALGLSLGLLLVLEAAHRQRGYLSLLAGVAAAFAYLANGRGLIALGAVLLVQGLLAVRRRTSWLAPLLALAGFLTVFAVEALVYYAQTGDPLLSWHIQSGASLFKYLHEPVTTQRFGALTVLYTNGRPLELTETVFVANLRGVDQFGYFFYLFAASAAFCLVRGYSRLLVGLAVALFLYLDFGPIRLNLTWSPFELRYFMVFKQERFALLLTGPCLVLSACLLAAVGRRSRIAAIILLAVLFSTSLAAIVQTRAAYRGGLADLRAATTYILEHPGQRYLGDFWAVEHVRIFSRYRAKNVQVLDARATLADAAGSCLMLGGSRGVELMPGYVASSLPAFARDMLQDLPPGWTQVMASTGAQSAYRERDFTIVCSP